MYIKIFIIQSIKKKPFRSKLTYYSSYINSNHDCDSKFRTQLTEITTIFRNLHIILRFFLITNFVLSIIVIILIILHSIS